MGVAPESRSTNLNMIHPTFDLFGINKRTSSEESKIQEFRANDGSSGPCLERSWGANKPERCRASGWLGKRCGVEVWGLINFDWLSDGRLDFND